MRFKLIPRFLLLAGLCAPLASIELWLTRGLAAQKPRIVFSTLRFDNYEIHVMDDDGGNRENLTNHPVDDRDPDWSPDRTKIVFVSNRNLGVDQIYVMDADGQNQIKLTYGPRRKRDPDWSPDGGKIAFTVHADWKDDLFPHIAVMDAGGQNRERFEDHAMQPSWSPDGKKIAFVSWRGGHNEIYTIGADGQGVERMTHHLEGKWSPTFSPDGRQIAYMAKHEGFLHIYVVGADGKNPMRLTHNQEYHYHPTWSPDGKRIAYASSDNNQNFFHNAKIHSMTADGKHLEQLSDEHDGLDFQPDFSPVGLAAPPTAVSPAFKTATLWGRLKKLELNRR
ncbi:MAG: hypothetical protein OXN17_18760 [Candidatus Poribacteria bacterium]|nr:hypothetical protein [Candidatus Poribacteria bacterium]MDE0504263.1 hypothetical protein [Candidatus Poribacteria bacterium]